MCCLCVNIRALAAELTPATLQEAISAPFPCEDPGVQKRLSAGTFPALPAAPAFALCCFPASVKPPSSPAIVAALLLP